METTTYPTRGSSKQRRATASRRLRAIRRSGLRPRAMRWASSANRGAARDDGACGNGIGATAASGSQPSARSAADHCTPSARNGDARLQPTGPELPRACLRASPSQLRIAWRGRSARCAASRAGLLRALSCLVQALVGCVCARAARTGSLLRGGLRVRSLGGRRALLDRLRLTHSPHLAPPI